MTLRETDQSPQRVEVTVGTDQALIDCNILRYCGKRRSVRGVAQVLGTKCFCSLTERAPHSEGGGWEFKSPQEHIVVF